MPLNAKGVANLQVDIMPNAMQVTEASIRYRGPGVLSLKGSWRERGGERVFIEKQQCTNGGGKPRRSSGTPCCSTWSVGSGGT